MHPDFDVISVCANASFPHASALGVSLVTGRAEPAPGAQHRCSAGKPGVVWGAPGYLPPPLPGPCSVSHAGLGLRPEQRRSRRNSLGAVPALPEALSPHALPTQALVTCG